MKRFLETLRDFIRPLSVFVLILVLLLCAVVSGIMEAVQPGLGIKFTGGVAGWFRAVPEAYYTLTGALALGYTTARAAEKVVEHRERRHHRHFNVDDPPGGA